MDKVTAIRRRLSREQWKAIITECRSSGMTTTAWCEANNICEQTYYKHLKQLCEEMIDSLPKATVISTEARPAIFSKLEVQAPITNNQVAVIIRLGHATVEICEGASQQTVQAVLLALQNI